MYRPREAICAYDQLLKVTHVAEAVMHALDSLNEQLWCSRTFYEDYPEHADMAKRVDSLRSDAKRLAHDAYKLSARHAPGVES